VGRERPNGEREPQESTPWRGADGDGSDAEDAAQKEMYMRDISTLEEADLVPASQTYSASRFTKSETFHPRGAHTQDEWTQSSPQ